MPRITDNMVFTELQQGVGAAGERLRIATARASAGKGVLSPGDNPGAAAQDVAITFAQGQLEHMGAAAGPAQSRIDATDSALQEMQPLLARVKELTISANNAGASPENRSAIAIEIRALGEAVLSFANRTHSGTYLFAGHLEGTTPFLADGTYNGDSGIRTVEVAPGINADVNVPGNSVFNVPGGTNILADIEAIAVAMEANDPAGMQKGLSDMDASINQISRAQSFVARAQTTYQQALTSRTQTEHLLATAHSQAIDDDAAKLMTRMVQAQSSYQAAIAEAVRILSSLDNSLRR